MPIRIPSVSVLFRSRSAFDLAALAIIAVAFLIRIYHLDTVGLEGDEAFSIHAAYSGFSNILQAVSTGEPHPPLYYSFLRLWYLLTGVSEFSLRYPSAMANVVTVVFLIKIANSFNWRLAGLIGAMLLALNPYMVWYSQEARMYAPLALFGAGAVYFALAALKRDTWRSLGAYALLVVLALYTHYYAIFLLAFINLYAVMWILHQGKPRATFVKWFGVQLVVVGLFLPWLAYAKTIVFSYNAFTPGSVDLIGVLRDALIRYSLGLSVSAEGGFTYSLVFLAIGIIGLLAAVRVHPRQSRWLPTLFMVGYAFLPIAMGMVVSMLRPMFFARYFMVSAPAFYLLMGLGVVALAKRMAPLGIVATLFITAAELFSLHNYFYDPDYLKTDFTYTIEYIREHARPGDAIIMDGLTQTFQFWYYYTLKVTDPLPSYLFPLAEPERDGPAAAKLDGIMASHQGAWLLDYDYASNDPERTVEKFLANNYYQALYRPVGQNRVVYYASAPSVAPNVKAINVVCDQTLLLKDFRSFGTSIKAGGILPIALRWQALKDVGRKYDVSWRLIDEDGHIVLQRDSGPASGFSPTDGWRESLETVDRYGILVPAYLPPGKYLLGVVIYGKHSGPCQLTLDGSPQPDGLIPLARVDVEDAKPIDTIAEISPSHKANFAFGEMSLIGYDLNGGPFRPGENATLRLFWQATDDISRDYEAVMSLRDAQGQLLQEREVAIGRSRFPTGQWQKGRRLAVYSDLPVPARAATGAYRLSLKLRADGLGERVFEGFPSMAVVARERRFDMPQSVTPKATRFGELIELAGYDLHPRMGETLSAGGTISLTLYWRDLQEMPTSYKVFTHLVGQDGKLHGQRDSLPLTGEAPTNSWLKGEVLADRYDILVKEGTPAGKYGLYVGFYEPEKGTRIHLADGSGDGLLLAEVTIVDSRR